MTQFDYIVYNNDIRIEEPRVCSPAATAVVVITLLFRVARRSPSSSESVVCVFCSSRVCTSWGYSRFSLLLFFSFIFYFVRCVCAYRFFCRPIVSRVLQELSAHTRLWQKMMGNDDKTAKSEEVKRARVFGSDSFLIKKNIDRCDRVRFYGFGPTALGRDASREFRVRRTDRRRTTVDGEKSFRNVVNRRRFITKTDRAKRKKFKKKNVQIAYRKRAFARGDFFDKDLPVVVVVRV